MSFEKPRSRAESTDLIFSTLESLKKSSPDLYYAYALPFLIALSEGHNYTSLDAKAAQFIDVEELQEWSTAEIRGLVFLLGDNALLSEI